MREEARLSEHQYLELRRANGQGAPQPEHGGCLRWATSSAHLGANIRMQCCAIRIDTLACERVHQMLVGANTHALACHCYNHLQELKRNKAYAWYEDERTLRWEIERWSKHKWENSERVSFVMIAKARPLIEGSRNQPYRREVINPSSSWQMTQDDIDTANVIDPNLLSLLNLSTMDLNTRFLLHAS